MKRVLGCIFMLVFEAMAILAPAQAYAFSGSMTIPGYSPAGGTFFPSGQSRFVNGVAKTTAIVNAAGKTVAVESTIAVAARAGITIARAAMGMSGLGMAIGVAAWLATGGIDWSPTNNRWELSSSADVWKEGYFWLSGNRAFDNAESALNSSLSDYLRSRPTLSGCKERYATEITDVTGMPYIKKARRGHTCYYPSGAGEQFSVEAVYQFQRKQETQTTQRPAVAGDGETHAATHPVKDEPGAPPRYGASDDVINQSPVPVPVEAPKVAPQVVPISNVYNVNINGVSTPVQDVLDIKSDDSTINPVDLIIVSKTMPVKDIPAPKVDPNPGASTGQPGTGSGNNGPAPEAFDLCKAYPDSVGCRNFGEDPNMEVPKSNASVSFAEENLGIGASCPSPIALPHGQSLSFQSACDAAPVVRAMVLAITGVMGMMIMVSAVRSK